MATSLPNPQASAPGPQQGAGPDQSQQANPLQEVLGRVIIGLRQLGAKNEVIQGEMTQAAQVVMQALQKVSQASSGPPVQPSAPPANA